MLETEKAEASIVWILNEGQPCAMGCLMGWHVITAAHCIPHVPSARVPGGDLIKVEIAPLKNPQNHIGLYVVGYEPCLDVAILSDTPLDGRDVPEEQSERFEALCNEIEEAEAWLLPDLSDFAPTDEVHVHLLNHHREWVSGRLIHNPLPDAYRLPVLLDKRGAVRSGTSGTPVFSNNGNVLGVHSVGITELGEQETHRITITYLKNSLPGWCLLRIRMGQDPQVLSEWMRKVHENMKRS